MTTYTVLSVCVNNNTLPVRQHSCYWCKHTNLCPMWLAIRTSMKYFSTLLRHVLHPLPSMFGVRGHRHCKHAKHATRNERVGPRLGEQAAVLHTAEKPNRAALNSITRARMWKVRPDCFAKNVILCFTDHVFVQLFVGWNKHYDINEIRPQCK